MITKDQHHRRKLAVARLVNRQYPGRFNDGIEDASLTSITQSVTGVGVFTRVPGFSCFPQAIRSPHRPESI